MLTIARIIAAAGFLWAAVALAVQLVLAWGGGRRDYGVRAGSPARGVVYNFTAAMSPAHKETVRLHPAKFMVGVLMHVGTLTALAKVLYVLARPAAPPVFPAAAGVVWGVALAASLYLFGRRVLAPNLRKMSCLDDYLAVLATAGLIIVAALHEFGVASSTLLLFYGDRKSVV